MKIADAKRTLTLFLHREETASVLVSLTGRNSDSKWLPRSQIEIAPERVDAPATKERKLSMPMIMVTLPDWLAKSKGLIADAAAGQGRLL